MALCEPFDDLVVRFGDANGWMKLGPLTPSGDDWTGDQGEPWFLFGTIEVHRRDSEVLVTDASNAFEPLSFAYMRDNIRSLRHEGRGKVVFGDHDLPQIIELRSMPSGRVRITVDLVSLDIWGLVVTEVSLDSLSTVVGDIDRIEERMGSLNGYCEPCGLPEPGFISLPSE